MQRDLDAYLWDISRAVDAIESYCAGSDFETYVQNHILRDAVERRFEIIGEALKQCESCFPGSTKTLPNVSGFARFRDKLAHGYFNIDPPLVWRAIQTDIPPLREAVRTMLAGKTPPQREDPFSDS